MGGGLEGGKEEGAPAQPQPTPSRRPPPPRDSAKQSGRGAAKKRVLPPNWVASEDPGATE